MTDPLESFPDVPKKGDVIYFFDDNRVCMAATVTCIMSKLGPNSDRPFLNLTVHLENGLVMWRRYVAPAYHNGEHWVMLSRWAYRGEIPEEEYEFASRQTRLPNEEGIQVPLP